MVIITFEARFVQGEVNSNQGFYTKSVPYLQLLATGNSSIKALITTNNTIGNGYSFQKTPDGLGAFHNKDDTVDVVINHELDHNEDGEYAKVSRLTLNGTGAILTGKLFENGSGKYNVFCSAYLIEGHGFARPIFMTNQEIDNGTVVAYDALNGNKTEMPWLGKFSHENTILLPGYSNKTVMLETEDAEYDHSQLYMYVSNSPSDLMHGNGVLYVFAGDGKNITNFRNMSKGHVYAGHFELLVWNWKTQNDSALEEEVQNKNALNFIRLEDLHYDQNNNSRIYVVDTGDDGPGEQYKNGRIYALDLFTPYKEQKTSSLLPYSAKIAILQDGNNGDEIQTMWQLVIRV